MKIALVHDYLREYGGAERVVEVMHEIWPQAPLFTSFVDWEALGKHAYRFANWDIRSSWVQHNPIVKKLHSPLRFLAPRIWESFSAKGGSASGGDLSGYDVVLSSSGWFISRGVKTQGGPSTGSGRAWRAIHICYIHHPPRNLYGYATGSTVENYWPVKVYASLINFFLRHWDYETAQRVDYFIANSQETARRVKKFYRRESTVIYPPIEIPELRITNYELRNKKAYFLSVGRLEWAKRTDVIIQACNRLKLPLKVVGTGSEEEVLGSIAGPTVEFLGSVSDAQLTKLYQGARALLFCALDEDFGMVPVEAMAGGTPVIALAQGGVLETVIDGQTGIIFHQPTISSLSHALEKFLHLKQDWTNACMNQAQKFSKERFKRELQAFVEEKVHSTASK